MFKKILVPIENSKTDEVIFPYVESLAKTHGAQVIFLHVADGFVARNQEAFNLQDSEEMRKDRVYLDEIVSGFAPRIPAVRAILETGEPGRKIVDIAERESVDLIAMATHGHRFISDVLLGSVAEAVRHRTSIPIFLVRAP